MTDGAEALARSSPILAERRAILFKGLETAGLIFRKMPYRNSRTTSTPGRDATRAAHDHRGSRRQISTKAAAPETKVPSGVLM